MKPCRKLRPPTGPISPAQNAPASGIGPRSSSTRPASWSGTPKRCRPRPLHVNSRAASASTPGEQLPEVLVGRVGVADVELHGLADADLLADRERARALVGAEQVADEEVAPAELGLVLVDDEPDVQAAAEQLALLLRGGAGELLEALDRRLARPAPR